MNKVNEALLEMYYFQPTIEAFRSTFSNADITIFKPTQNKEGWLGFDQAFLSMEYSNEEFTKIVKDNEYKEESMEKFYFGYFMQYKVMERIGRIYRNTKISIPESFVKGPYYRFELSTKRKSYAPSQHELLKQLSDRIENAFVYYVSSMLLEVDSIFTEPDLGDLRIVNLSDAPSLAEWDLEDRHFIMFENKDSPEYYWCSNPKKAKSKNYNNWITGLNKLTGNEAINLIKRLRNFIKKKAGIDDGDSKVDLPPSFNLIQIIRSKSQVKN